MFTDTRVAERFKMNSVTVGNFKRAKEGTWRRTVYQLLVEKMVNEIKDRIDRELAANEED